MARNRFDLTAYKEYLSMIPVIPEVERMNDEELEQHLYDAYEDIYTIAPTIKITPRMVIKQLEFKLTVKNQGYESMYLAGVKSQKIDDASIEFKDSMISPFVLGIIKASSRGRTGWLR